MMMCPSGGGKDAPMKYVSNVLHKAGRAHYIGESAPASDTAILMNLSDTKNQRIDVIDEASKLFMAMGDKGSSTWQNMANVYQELFTAAGSMYNGKSALKYKTKDNIHGTLGQCVNPYVNLLCAMTVSDFKNHFTTDLMEKGLGGRFLYFPDDEEKLTDANFRGVSTYSTESIYFIREWLDEVDPTDAISLMKKKKKTKEVVVANREKVRRQILDVERQCVKDINDNSMRSILVRHHVTVKKLALIKAVDEQFSVDPDDIAIEQRHIDWAIEWGESYLKNITLFFEDNLHDSKIERAEQTIIEYIKHRNKQNQPATKQYLGSCRKLKKLNIDGTARNRLIRDLMEQRVIIQNDDGFYHKDFVCTKM
jgi:hypothetical protein